MDKKIMLTGSEGLIGKAIHPLLASAGCTVLSLDKRLEPQLPGSLDVCEHQRVAQLVTGCSGIIHLAAVSRVVWGERDPVTCHRVNVEALANIVDAAARSASEPWLIFASSREVYGQQSSLPVREDVELRPMNVYARSKVDGEEIVQRAAAGGLRAAIIRLSNVFGRADDHPDRVIPAFCRAAIKGDPLRVDGRNHMFDFTYASDVADGIISLVNLLEAGETPPPPIHFTSSRGITLGEAAEAITQIIGSDSPFVEAPPRSFDVERFVGNNTRAQSILGWEPRHPFEEAIRLFTDELKASL